MKEIENLLNKHHYQKMTEEEILIEIQVLTKLLGGKYLHQTAINTSGDSVKRIIIEYDNEIEEKS